MVRGRHHQRRLQLHRSSSGNARRSGRHHLGRRRPQRIKEDHLPGAARSGLPPRQRAAQPQRREGRPRHHLLADDSGSRVRHPRLRAHRRDPLGRVRRFLAGIAGRPHRGLPVESRHHRRRRSARRPQGAAEGQHRRGDRESRRRGRPCHRGQAHRRAGRHAARPRRLVSRRRRHGDGRMSVDGDARRGSAVHPLHVRLDRKAERRAAHDRRLSRLHRDDPPRRLRLSRRRHLLVHRRRRLGHRPQLHRLRAARQRRHHADVRRRAELSDHVAVLGGDRQAQGQHLLHRADGDPRAHAGRRRTGEEIIARIVAAPRLGRRADQSGSLGVVSPRRRRRPLPDRRYLVADGNRRHPHHAIAGSDARSSPARRRCHSSA